MSLLFSEHSAFTPLSHTSMALGNLPDYVIGKNSSSPVVDVISKSSSLISNRSSISSPSLSPNSHPRHHYHRQELHQRHGRREDNGDNVVDNDDSYISPSVSDSNSEGAHSSPSSPESPGSPLSPGVETRPPSAKENTQCSLPERAFSFSVDDILKPDKKKHLPPTSNGGDAITTSGHSKNSSSSTPRDLRWNSVPFQPQATHLHPHHSLSIPPQIQPTPVTVAITQPSAVALPEPSAPGLSSWFLNPRLPQSNCESLESMSF